MCSTRLRFHFCFLLISHVVYVGATASRVLNTASNNLLHLVKLNRRNKAKPPKISSCALSSGCRPPTESTSDRLAGRLCRRYRSACARASGSRTGISTPSSPWPPSSTSSGVANTAYREDHKTRAPLFFRRAIDCRHQQHRDYNILPGGEPLRGVTREPAGAVGVVLSSGSGTSKGTSSSPSTPGGERTHGRNKTMRNALTGPPKVGFVGLGKMGFPMAANIFQKSCQQEAAARDGASGADHADGGVEMKQVVKRLAGFKVWNRTPAKSRVFLNELFSSAPEEAFPPTAAEADGGTAAAVEVAQEVEDMWEDADKDKLTPHNMADCDIVFMCLPTSREVGAVCARLAEAVGEPEQEERSAAPTTDPRMIVVDCTSGSRKQTILIGKMLAEKRIALLDCPVSGGPSGAAAGTLAAMIGCGEQQAGAVVKGTATGTIGIGKANEHDAVEADAEGEKILLQTEEDEQDSDKAKGSVAGFAFPFDREEVLARVLPLIEGTFAGKGKVHVVGPLGSGHAVKSLNNVLNSLHLIAATEGLLSLKKIGIEPATALRCINSSSGRSLQTEQRLPEQILTGKYNYGFALSLMSKDCELAREIVFDAFKTAGSSGREILSSEKFWQATHSDGKRMLPEEWKMDGFDVDDRSGYRYDQMQRFLDEENALGRNGRGNGNTYNHEKVSTICPGDSLLLLAADRVKTAANYYAKFSKAGVEVGEGEEVEKDVVDYTYLCKYLEEKLRIGPLRDEATTDVEEVEE